MPVRKFRSIEDMPGPPALPPLAPDNLREAFSMMDLAYRLFPWSYPPGVHKYRSIDAANAARGAWETGLIRKGRGKT